MLNAMLGKCSVWLEFLIYLLFLLTATELSAQNYLVRNVSLITMEDEAIRNHQDVFISNGIIKAIEPEMVLEKSSITVIDGTGKYLMPGLADMHMHFASDTIALRLYLANGITTVHDFSGIPEYLTWQQEIESGVRIGPQIYVTSPLWNDIRYLQNYHSLPRGLLIGILLFFGSAVVYILLRIVMMVLLKKRFFGWRIEVSFFGASLLISSVALWKFCPTPQIVGDHVYLFARHWEISRGIKTQIEQGYNAIKLHETLTRQQFISILKYANENNFATIGHLPSSVSPDDAIEYKIRGLAHAEELLHYFRKPNGMIDTTGLDQASKKISASGMFVLSTLNASRSLMDRQKNDSSYFLNPTLKYVPAKTLERYKNDGYKTPDQYSSEEYNLLTEVIRSCYRNNVTIVLGSDSKWMNDVHGFSVHDELALLVESGFSNYHALETATKNAAVSVQALHEWGTIAEGKKANLILLAGNPLEKISNTKLIAGVFTNGKWFDQARLSTMLQGVQEHSKANDRVIGQ